MRKPPPSGPSPESHSHGAEAFKLEPGFDLLRHGVVADVGCLQSGAARWWSLELLLSTATQSESVHQLVLDLLHVGLAALWVTHTHKQAFNSSQLGCLALVIQED